MPPATRVDDVLTTRVNGLQADFAEFRSEVGSAIKALSEKFDERSRTPWGHIWSAAGVLMAILVALGGLAYMPISQGQNALADTLKGVNERMVTDKELAAVIANTAARRDDAQRQTEARFGRLEAEEDALEKSIVPRGEHEEKWAGQRRVDEGLAEQIKALRSRMESDYMPKEAIEMLRARLDDIERRFNARG